MHFATGTRVRARGLTWDVLETQWLGPQQRLRLRCTAGDMQGLEWDLLHPQEPVQPIDDTLRPEAPAPLTAWRLHHIACLLDQLPGPADMLAADPGRLMVEPYQLVPLMRALEMPRPRLLLADAVGLGKTIQAGLIATEWLARRRAHRILVVSPPGPLLLQWHHELRDRFGLRFAVIDGAAALQRERRRIELGGNPFDAMALCLVSLDFARQEYVLEELERAAWDLAIIDEAHHCVSAFPGASSDATLRRRLAEVLARRSDGLLLLTATPHDGYDAHFASLIELLDPSLVDGRGGLAGTAYRRHVIRRLKSHIRDPRTGAPVFRERKVVPVRIEHRGHGVAAVRAFHAALAVLVAPRLRRARCGGDYADALAFIGLLKRSVSTVSACIATVRVVAARYRALRADATNAEVLRKERARALRSYRRRRLRFGVLDAAAEIAAEALEAEDIAADLHRFGTTGTPMDPRPDDTVLPALHELIHLGTAAEAHDPKLAALLDEVRLIRAAHPAANILVYTEYADSQAAAVQALRLGRGITGEILAISGLDPEPERTRVAEHCADHDGVVLVSTDSMAEGLNLHQRCHHLIHLDLPYNPNRLEQRNGRIDRYGQRQGPEIRYLYLAGTFEERLLLRLIAKYEKARACLDVMPDTLGATADESAWSTGLVAGFAEDQARLFDDATPPIRTLDIAAAEDNDAALRDLLHEIDRAFVGYERHAVHHGWLAEQGLNADLRQVAAAGTIRTRGNALSGHIDLPEFVAAAVAAETGAPVRSDDRIALPGDWSAGLDGLPGYDAATHTLRFTRDRDRLCAADGAPLAFLGRGHPLVRRAIAHVRHGRFAAGKDTSATHGDAEARHQEGSSGACDARVGVARADTTEPAVLLTFSLELAQANRGVLQRVMAVWLPYAGPPVEMVEPEHWLGLGGADRAISSPDAWRRWFVTWVPHRQPQAEKLANAAMQRLATAFIAEQSRQAARDHPQLEQWLTLRADDICGPLVSRTADLFGESPLLPAWQTLSGSLDRLAAFAADADNPTARRREANSAVALYRRRCAEAGGPAPSPPSLRSLGMLMVVPP